ncbi:CD5 antigen-like [Amphiura filiformis]|uniref:CD5 antigen-like n=1 Tax=Amphiura filiformis TaxID=82378 RepID=UPI003B20DCF8
MLGSRHTPLSFNIKNCEVIKHDVRLTGGSRPSTGIVEFFLDGKWGILCSTPWTITEADTTCRQSGYTGALINEGIIIDPPDGSMPIHKGTVNCTNAVSPRGFHSLFGCRKSLITEENTVCGWPNSVACARHQAELPVRLFGGHDNSSGRVEVSSAGIWWGICSDQWNLKDATVVCNQLGFTDSKGFNNSARVDYPKGHEDRFYLMSNVNCTGEETNIGLCKRVYGTHTCPSGNYAKASCVARKTGRVFNKAVLVTILCLLLIPVFLLILFVVVFCVYKKRKSESSTEQKSVDYTSVDQKESIEMNNGNKKGQIEPEKV